MSTVMKRLEKETEACLGIIWERTDGLHRWVVPPGGGFPDVPAGSVLFYKEDGSAPREGLCIVRENRPNGRMYARVLWHEVTKIRLVQTARGELYGEEIVIDLKDTNPEYVCCGKVRVQFSPVEPLPYVGGMQITNNAGKEAHNG